MVKKYGTMHEALEIVRGKINSYQEITHQTLAIIPVCFMELMMGIGYGWASPTLHKLTEPGSKIPLNTEQCSWIGSLVEFGGIFGPLISALLLDSSGRAVLLRCCALTFFVAYLIVVFYKTVWAIYLLRSMSGIALGATYSSTSIYMAEVSSTKVRAVFCGITIVAFYFGQFLEFIIGAYLSYSEVAIINAAIAFVGLTSCYLLTESPYYLIMKGNLKKAQRNYLWLRGTSRWEDVNVEFEQIRQSLETEKLKKESYKKLLKNKVNRRSVRLMLIVAFLTKATGYEAMISFVYTFFSSNKTLSVDEFIILFGGIQVIGALITILIIERFNRRTLLLACYALSAFSHLVSATLYFIDQRITLIGGFSWMIFASISSYVAIYALMYSVAHTIRGELFPQSVKAIGGPMSMVVESIAAFLTANVFLYVSEWFGVYTNFMLYFFVNIVAFVFVYLKLPETRGRSLVDIQKSIWHCEPQDAVVEEVRG